MNYFNGVTNAVDAKRLYKELCKKLHPDVGGSTEAFQELNRQYLEGNKRGWTVVNRNSRPFNNPTGAYRNDSSSRRSNADSFSKSQRNSPPVAKYSAAIDFVANKARENKFTWNWAFHTLLKWGEEKKIMLEQADFIYFATKFNLSVQWAKFSYMDYTQSKSI